MRSHLLIRPEDRNEFARALASGADCLWLDLESAGQKIWDFVPHLVKEARQRTMAPRLYVRIGGFDRDVIDDELDSVMKAAPDGIVLSQVRHGADIQHLGAKLAVREAKYGLADGSTRIIAMAAQSPAAIFQMGTYVDASQRLIGLAWSPDALASAIGISAAHHQNGVLTAPLELARTLTLIAAKAAGVAAIDGATGDRARFRAECEAALRDGFSGKIASNPNHVAIINAVFGSCA